MHSNVTIKNVSWATLYIKKDRWSGEILRSQGHPWGTATIWDLGPAMEVTCTTKIKCFSNTAFKRRPIGKVLGPRHSEKIDRTIIYKIGWLVA